MPQPPGIARRHRWFIGVLVLPVVAPLLFVWSPAPLPVTAVAIVLLTALLFIWIMAGPSWVWAAGPPRPADAVSQARQVGRSIMVVMLAARLILELIFWMFGWRDDRSGTETFFRTIFTGVGIAFVMGKFFEYQWSRRPENAPVPWLFRVWPLRS